MRFSTDPHLSSYRDPESRTDLASRVSLWRQMWPDREKEGKMREERLGRVGKEGEGAGRGEGKQERGNAVFHTIRPRNAAEEAENSV